MEAQAPPSALLLLLSASAAAPVLAASPATGPEATPPAPAVSTLSSNPSGDGDGIDRVPTVYAVATAHLDTQWRWTIQETIDEFIPATLHTNFRYFDRYPGYRFSFEGSFRYQLMKEYYPEEYGRLRQEIAAGRWKVCGSWVDAVDTNIPSPESLVRHALYGNGYFRREFGVESRDVFLPDCFGFGYALPSIAAHCGLTAFSTQKLTWGSANGVPFDVGLWEGVDGSRLVAAIRPGAYVVAVRRRPEPGPLHPRDRGKPADRLRAAARLPLLRHRGPGRRSHRGVGGVADRGAWAETGRCGS